MGTAMGGKGLDILYPYCTKQIGQHITITLIELAHLFGTAMVQEATGGTGQIEWSQGPSHVPADAN
jgi:hypothetical protein